MATGALARHEVAAAGRAAETEALMVAQKFAMRDAQGA